MIDDKNRKLLEGLKSHYKNVVSIAEKIRNNLRKSAQSADKCIPIIAMGRKNFRTSKKSLRIDHSHCRLRK